MALRPGDRQWMREWNERLVLNTIRQHEPLTRGEIAQRTGLGRSTVTVITGRLLRQGLIAETAVAGSEETARALGRRPTILTLKARALSVLGIKLGPEQVTASILDLHAEIVATVVLPLTEPQNPEHVISRVVDAAQRVQVEAADDLGPAIGAGVVMPGVVDPEQGSCRNGFAPGWARMPLRPRLAEALGVPVYVDNDANAVALAERWFGAGKGADTLLCLTVGVGIGGGVVVGGKLHRGYKGGAGELGHTLAQVDGPPCNCGRRGCLDAVAADPALCQETGLTWPELSALAQTGDPRVGQALTRAGRLIGAAVANSVNLLAPDRVVVGGERMLTAGSQLLESVSMAVQQHVFPALATVPVVPWAVGVDGWVKGAAVLVLEEAFRAPLEQSDAMRPSLENKEGSEGGRTW